MTISFDVAGDADASDGRADAGSGYARFRRMLGES